MTVRDSGSVSDQGTDRNARTHDQENLITKARTANRERRAAVLSHPDLAKRLTEPPLNYTHPEQWNGYIPPAVALNDDHELLRNAQTIRDGSAVARWNQVGRHTGGTILNDSPRREALLQISAEAWNRKNAKETP